VETGFAKEKLEGNDKVQQQPEVIIRYGLFSSLELRLNLTVEVQDLASENIYRDGFRPIEPGIQAVLYETKDQKFTTAVQAHAGLPIISSGKHDPGKVYHRIRLLVENELSDKLSLSLNAGSDWDDEEHEQNWIYGVSPELELTDRLKLMAEVYGHWKEGNYPEHIANAGLAFAVHDNIQLNVHGGVGLNDAAPRSLFGFGLSFRIK
jgi:hypothetical protein